MLTYNFTYSLPYTNHRKKRPDVQFEIEAVLEGTIVCFVPPVSEDIVNLEIAIREITALARGEFDKMLRIIRIKEGEKILKSVTL